MGGSALLQNPPCSQSERWGGRRGRDKVPPPGPGLGQRAQCPRGSGHEPRVCSTRRAARGESEPRTCGFSWKEQAALRSGESFRSDGKRPWTHLQVQGCRGPGPGEGGAPGVSCPCCQDSRPKHGVRLPPSPSRASGRRACVLFHAHTFARLPLRTSPGASRPVRDTRFPASLLILSFSPVSEKSSPFPFQPGTAVPAQATTCPAPCETARALRATA